MVSVGLKTNGREGLLKAAVGRLRRLRLSKSGPCKVLLPEDLLKHIFDELDVESARQCALASRLFAKSARSRLFERIVLKEEQDTISRPSLLGRLEKKIASIWNRPTKSQQLAELLAKSPDLAEFVKELIIEGQPHTMYPWYLQTRIPFHDILPRLPNLQSLSFLFQQDYALSFGSIPAPSCMAIFRALRSPKIRQVVVENILFSDDERLLFLRHATAGGGLKRLSITAFNSIDARLSRIYSDWDHAAAPSSLETNPKNVLQTLQVNGAPRVVEQILTWAISEQSVLNLSSLSKFEVVGAITPTQLNLVAQISQCSPHLGHLGLTSGEEPLLSTPTTHRNHHPLTHTLHSNSSLTQNLHTIIFYAISYAHDPASLPSPAHCLSWWCTLFARTSFPNLHEFRVDRRGYSSYFLLSPEDEIVSDMGTSRIDPESWQELERALVKGAPKARLRIDLEAQGWARRVEIWKEWHFPSGDGVRGCRHLNKCFPLAHQGRIGLVFNLRVWVKLLLPTRWLQRQFAKRKSAYERGCYVYTPQQRWVRVDDEPIGSMGVNAIRSDFVLGIEDQNA
ncbi:hypothetical protein V5O48_011794 [Marasmius crinis-equi]|uniref:F-box domain-containing protein n=1 Tax=Marasmius crinis-equi TaxID=585013 RepID=A0ABR3F4M2_9AGAR